MPRRMASPSANTRNPPSAVLPMARQMRNGSLCSAPWTAPTIPARSACSAPLLTSPAKTRDRDEHASSFAAPPRLRRPSALLLWLSSLLPGGGTVGDVRHPALAATVHGLLHAADASRTARMARARNAVRF